VIFLLRDFVIGATFRKKPMTKFELQVRTKQFHVDVIRLCTYFPKNAAGFETAKQLIRSAGSVGANYRAACRAKSKADFIYKIEIVLEEADESLYWLEVTKEAGLMRSTDLDRLIKEANEITRIFNAADLTAKKNRANQNLKITKSQNHQISNVSTTTKQNT
jgi:four helix bundle protein